MTGTRNHNPDGPVGLQAVRASGETQPADQEVLLPADGGVLGRGDGCDVELADPRVSRTHCRILRGEGGWLVEDLGSRSGTRVDSVLLSEGERAPIQSGSLLEIGRCTFIVRGIAAVPVDVGSDVLVSPETGELLLKNIHDSSTSVRDLAWTAFDAQYSDVIRGYARRFGVRGQEEDDVVQEVYLGLHKLQGGVQYDRSRGQFRNYLMVATRNAVRTRLRQQATEHGDGLDQLAEPRADADWDHQWAESMLQRALRDLQRAMTPAHYDAFERFGRRGESAAEVAKAVGMTAEHVRKIKHRGIRLLQQIVASYGHPPG